MRKSIFILILMVGANGYAAPKLFPTPEDEGCDRFLNGPQMVQGFTMPYRIDILEATKTLNRSFLKRIDAIFLALAMTGSHLKGIAWNNTSGGIFNYEVASTQIRYANRSDEMLKNAIHFLEFSTIMTIELTGRDAETLESLAKETEFALANSSVGIVEPLTHGQKLLLWLAAQSLRVGHAGREVTDNDLFSDSVRKSALLAHAFTGIDRITVIKEKVLKPYNEKVIIPKITNPYRLIRSRSAGDRFYFP